MKKTKIFNFSLFWSFFIAFSGYYVILMLVSNFLSNDFSRYFTIPLRLLLVLFFYILFKLKSIKYRKEKITVFFLLFAAIYLLRIFTELLKNNHYYMSLVSFFLSFLSFVFIPIYLVSKIQFSSKDYRIILISVLVGSMGVAILTYFFYGDLIGQVARISQEIGKDENYISPLALSYCSVLGIGTGISYLLANKVNKSRFLYISTVILISLIPFFLGASRGAIVSIIVPFIMYVLFSKGVKSKSRFIFIGLLFAMLVFYSTSYFGIGVFNRFTGTYDAIETGSSSAVRLLIWKSDFNQFLENPLMGNSLQSEFAGHHSHNIIVESMITTGILGTIPFLIFLFLIFRKVVKIIRYSPKYFWLTNLFLIGFMQNMFSGAIWGMSWTAIGAALIIGFNYKTLEDEYK
jgi:O-antigen ligase